MALPNAIGIGFGIGLALPGGERGRQAGRQAWRFKGAKGFYVRPNRSLFALLEAAEREKPLVLLALHSAPALTMAPAAALTERGAAT